jgi:hypothetical protein
LAARSTGGSSTLYNSPSFSIQKSSYNKLLQLPDYEVAGSGEISNFDLVKDISDILDMMIENEEN